ncbi:hypothetical protein [Demequina sp.]|uniref:GHMP family kinase ATP-binding protein n=1 Tax=Demequina sp. TaxID=2050685 RepID=UPI0034502208
MGGSLDSLRALASQNDWVAYPAGVLWALLEHGYSGAGTDIAFASCVPRSAGLSSSAALTAATALAANGLWGSCPQDQHRRSRTRAGVHGRVERRGWRLHRGTGPARYLAQLSWTGASPRFRGEPSCRDRVSTDLPRIWVGSARCRHPRPTPG